MSLGMMVRTGSGYLANLGSYRVLEQPDEVGLAGLLQRGDGAGLEAQVGLEILSDFPHKALVVSFGL